jgi:hypothetical protein
VLPESDVEPTGVTNFNGSITKTFELEFGVGGLSVGATVDDTADNIAAALSVLEGATVSSNMNVVDIELDIAGELGNDFTLNSEDLGTQNFELNQFSGGQKSDIITINGVPFAAVSNSPTSNQFLVGANINTTLNNLANQVNSLAVALATVVGSVLTVSANTPGSAGNDVTLEVEETNEDTFVLSGETLEGGQDNLRAATSTDNVNFVDYVPDTDVLFNIAVNQDSLLVVTKSDLDGNQILPRTSIQNQVDSGIAKRYYSDNGEISFLIASTTPNAFIVGATDVNLFGRGTVGGNPNIRVDQFIFRTSPFEDDINNLRAMEIPVLSNDRVRINLLGGVS